MPGGKGKSIGGKGGSKESAGKTQKSHSAKAGLQVGTMFCFYPFLPSDWGCRLFLFYKSRVVGAMGCEIIGLVSLTENASKIF